MGLLCGAIAMLFAIGCEEEAPEELTFSVSPRSVSIPAEGGSAEVKAEVPAAWSVDIDARWVQIVPASGDKGTYTIVFSAQKNDTGETRTATAVVSVMKTDEATDPASITITVIQTSVAVEPPAPDPVLTFSGETSYNMDEKGGVVQFSVNSNVPWTVENSLQAFTVTPTSGVAGETAVVVTVPENTVQEARRAILTFKYGTKSSQVTISQDAAKPTPPEPSLTLSAGNKMTIGYQGGSLRLTVSSNVAWTASVEADDISVKPSSGEAGDPAVVIEIAENKVEKNRETHITFSYSDKSVVLTIVQEAAPHQENPEVGIAGEINGWQYGGTISFEETEEIY